MVFEKEYLRVHRKDIWQRLSWIHHDHFAFLSEHEIRLHFPVPLVAERSCGSEWVSEVAQSCPTLWPCGLQPTSLLSPWDSPGKNTGVGCHALLQGNLPYPGIEPGSPALQAVSLLSKPPGKPENTGVENTGVDSISLSRGISRPRNRTGVSFIAGELFTGWTTREDHSSACRTC